MFVLYTADDVSCPCGTDDSNECFNIPLEGGHGFGSCIPFIRSIPVLNDDCEPSTYVR